MYSSSMLPTSLALGRPITLPQAGSKKGGTQKRNQFSGSKSLIFSWLTIFQDSFADKMPDKEEVTSCDR